MYDLQRFNLQLLCLLEKLGKSHEPRNHDRHLLRQQDAVRYIPVWCGNSLLETGQAVLWKISICY